MKLQVVEWSGIPIRSTIASIVYAAAGYTGASATTTGTQALVTGEIGGIQAAGAPMLLFAVMGVQGGNITGIAFSDPNTHMIEEQTVTNGDRMGVGQGIVNTPNEFAGQFDIAQFQFDWTNSRAWGAIACSIRVDPQRLSLTGVS
jgi:hypothetical protein